MSTDEAIREIKPGRALVAFLVFYAAMIFLNSEGIRKDVEMLPYGNFRSVCLSVFSPIEELSGKLFLTYPKVWFKSTAGAMINHEKITAEE